VVRAADERYRHARLERLLDQPDLLRHRPPPAALHRGDHLDAPDLLRHSRTPRLMPRPSRYAACPLETGAAPPDADAIKLRDVLIPQHARGSRLCRVLPRDYRRKLRESGGEALNALAQDEPFAENHEANTHWE